MPHGAHVYSLIEDALAEGFQYHNGLDTFLRRAGVPEARLAAAPRQRAEERAKASQRNHARAPKRFVVQELLTELGTGSEEADRLVAGLVTAICKGKFPDATERAKVARNSLLAQGATEREEAEARREEQRRKGREDERNRERIAAEKVATRERFKKSFIQLSQQSDPQARGYMLEKFLNDFLDFEGLSPRGSFKLVGEQN